MNLNQILIPLDLQYFADATMHARDAIHGAQGVAWVTIDGNRYKFAQLINIEARSDKTKTQIPIMGTKWQRGIRLLVLKIQVVQHFTLTLLSLEKC